MILRCLLGLPVLLALLTSACEQGARAMQEPENVSTVVDSAGSAPVLTAEDARRKTAYEGRVIHLLVALCDNEYQGIVPVPARIGNGDDPARNLYWGAAYGVKTFFSRAKEWKLVMTDRDTASGILERLVFRHKTHDAYLVADAYRGREIRDCTIDFLRFAAGDGAALIPLSHDNRRTSIPAGGAADLVAYIGHDGLMDFSLDTLPQKADDRRRDAIILACISRKFFREPLRAAGANPLLLTTGLMAPEAYVMKAALDGWLLGEDGEKIRSRAAESYNHYQKCGIKAARGLFVTGG